VEDILSFKIGVAKKKTLGARIRLARETAGLSQAALARKIKAAVTSVSRWELDRNPPGPGRLKAIARVCGIQVNSLTAGIKAPPKIDKNRAPVDAEKRLNIAGVVADD
jgi:transcriptional regulator with XRE-family HTH domain